MNRTTLSVLLLLFICCGWPLIVHASILWIKRRDWASGEWSKLFGKKDEE